MIATALFLTFAILFVLGTPVGGGARARRHACDLSRRSRIVGGADQHLYRHRQIPASRRADVRARRLALRPLRGGAAIGPLHAGADRPQGRLARGRDRDREHVPRRHLRLRPGERRGGRRRHDGRAVSRRLPQGLLGERHRRRRRDRHPHPAFDRAHHLQRAGAAGLGAGSVRGRDDPGHPGRHRAARADLLDVEEARLRPCRKGPAAPAALGELQGGDLGAARAGPDPRRHAGRAGSPRPKPP